MPVRRGHVAPQNTFIDTIIRKFDGQSKFRRRMLTTGFRARMLRFTAIDTGLCFVIVQPAV